MIQEWWGDGCGWHTQTLLRPVILHFFSLILTPGWPSPQGGLDLVDRSKGIPWKIWVACLVTSFSR